MKKSLLITALLIFLFTACSSNKTQTVSYITEEDQAEEETLTSFQANLKINSDQQKNWQNLDLNEYGLAINYPKNILAEKKDSPEYLSRYVFKETDKKNDDKAPSFELRVIAGNFEDTLKNIEQTMEVNSKEQVTIGASTVGVKLTGVDNGQLVILFPVGQNTIMLKNSSLNLQETFLEVAGTIEVK